MCNCTVTRAHELSRNRLHCFPEFVKDRIKTQHDKELGLSSGKRSVRSSYNEILRYRRGKLEKAKVMVCTVLPPACFTGMMMFQDNEQQCWVSAKCKIGAKVQKELP